MNMTLECYWFKVMAVLADRDADVDDVDAHSDLIRRCYEDNVPASRCASCVEAAEIAEVSL